MAQAATYVTLRIDRPHFNELFMLTLGTTVRPTRPMQKSLHKTQVGQTV
jgi:hypothetical protein